MRNAMKVMVRLISTVATALLLSTSARSAFLDPIWSARVAGLGGAYTALSDDAAGIFYNPAGGAGMKRKEVVLSYAKLLTGLESVNLSLGQIVYAQPLGKFSTLGIGWGHFQADNLYREDTFLISFARSLKPFFTSYNGELSIGISAKVLMRSFTMADRTSGDPAFKEGGRKSAAAIDLHVHSVPEPALLPGLSLGLTARSVNSPDIGLQASEHLPVELVGGILYRWNNFAFPIDAAIRKGSLNPSLGVEMNLMNDALALRLGGGPDQISTGLGVSRAITQDLNVAFEYAFIMPIIVEGTTGSHRATIGIKF